MHRVFRLAPLLALLVACGNPGKSICAKAKECCATFSICTEINAQGQGYEERCGISFNETIDKLHTYGNDACNKVADTYDDYIGCMGGVQCTDVVTAITDFAHVPKCDTQAKAYCNAQKASGDACGHDYRTQNCDNYTANGLAILSL